MSKIGSNPVLIDPEVKVTLKDNEAFFQGPKGELKLQLPKEIEIKIIKNTASFYNRNVNKKSRSLHGLTRMLFANAVYGVKNLWEKTLEIHGVGFRVKPEGKDLVFQIGYSHPVIFKVPDSTTATIKGNKILISGVDKQQVGEVAGAIRRIRKPDKYKGKGIRYQGEVIKLKPGKKAKTTA
jgi:large subunit ribosomal protein L6